MANVSHEVRTPLFSLKGFLETLLDGGIDDPEVNRPFLEKSLHHAQRIDNLLRDLIDISRIESGEMRMSFRYFALSSLLEQIQRDHADAAANRLQILRIEVDDPSVEVLGDRERLRQALSNLVENAMKYSPEKSTVTIGVERRADRVRLTVKDNGPGIAAEHVPRIFERFYRVDPDRSRELGGTGLGLAIVKHIVEAHGSEIEVTTQAGNGSAFSFQLKA
jgi:two-component system phosphate regulon sensor histidine kinase PhoR